MDTRFARPIRIALAVLGAIAAIFAVVIVLLLAGLINRPALWLVGEATGYRLECQRLDGALLGHVVCDGAVLADADGVFLTAQHLDLAWQGLKLLDNRVAIEALTLGGARLTRIPSSNGPSSGDILPSIDIAIGHIAVSRFTLALNTAPSVCAGLSGTMSAGPKGLAGDLTLERCVPPRGHVALRGSYDKASGALSVLAQGDDDGALIAALLDLPEAGATTLSASGHGTIRSFDGHVALAAQHVGALEARFRAQPLIGVPVSTALRARASIDPALLPDFAPKAPLSLAGTLTYSDAAGLALSGAALSWGAVAAVLNAAQDPHGRLELAATIARAPLPNPLLVKLFGQNSDLRLSLSHLPQGARLIDASLTAPDATFQAQLTLAKTGRGGAARLSLRDLSTVAAALKGKAVLSLNLTRWSPEGDIAATATLTSTPLDLTAEAARKPSGALSVSLHSRRGDLAALLGSDVAGAFALDGRLRGTFAAPDIALTITAPSVVAGGQSLSHLMLTLGARRGKAWGGDFAVSGLTAAGRLDLVARADQLPAGWQVRIDHGALGGAALSGAMAFAGKTYAGNFSLSGDVLAPIGLITGTALHGQGSVSLTGDGRGLTLLANLNGVHGSGFDNASLTGSARMAALNAPITAKLALADGADRVSLSAVAKLAPLRVTLAQASGRWAGLPFALSAPATITSASGVYDLAGLEAQVAGGALSLSAHGGGEGLTARLSLAQFPVDPLAHLAGAGSAKGALDVTLDADLGPRATRADLSLHAQGVDFAHGGRMKHAADVALDGHWDGVRAVLSGGITGAGFKTARFEAAIPLLRRPRSLMAELPSNGPVSGHLAMGFDLADLMAVLPLAEQSATGELTADISLAGDLAHPELSGGLTLMQGSFTDYRSGTHLTELNASLTALPDSRAGFTLEAGDGGSGHIRATGQFQLAADEPAGIGGHLDLDLDNAEVLRGDLAEAAVSGKLALDLARHQPPKLSGSLRTETVRIDLAAAIPPAIPTIKVREIGGRSPVAADAAPARPSPFANSVFAVKVRMPNRVYVSGHGADTEWSGTLALAGTLAAPQVDGALEAVRGTIDLVGKSFTLNDGTVRIGTNLPGHALLDLTAENTQSDLTVTVKITGTANAPKIIWTSSPALPQSEIFSRLFFGTGTPQLSVGQAVQLAQLSGSLNGLGLGGGGDGVLGFARKLSGLDVLSVAAPNDLKGTGAAVTAGKYIGSKVYVGVTQGATATAGSAEVQVKVAPHVTVTGTAGSNNANSLGVDWKWSY